MPAPNLLLRVCLLRVPIIIVEEWSLRLHVTIDVVELLLIVNDVRGSTWVHHLIGIENVRKARTVEGGTTYFGCRSKLVISFTPG